MKNMVSLGASACVLNLPIEIFAEVLEERFAKKGQRIVDQNMNAIKHGFEFMKELGGADTTFALKPADGTRRLFMMGNEALGLGAFAAGARVMAAYPITPATDIMEYLIKKMPEVGGVVLQTEDEIAAMTMVIGAGYAGVRALTATSGPGMSLMMEAIGLSGMTETPTVIIDTQRGGPSTGLPTKQEQSDMLAALFGTHGEIPKIVLCPATPEECFTVMADAFNYAEYYQCPTIVMTDLQLSLSKQTTDVLKLEDIHINRGFVKSAQDLLNLSEGEEYKRFEVTLTGISPRVLPGTLGGIHHVTGIEHAESGRPFEQPLNRQNMMDKRLRKLQGVELPNSVIRTGATDAEIVLVGVGSNIGSLEEAVGILSVQGYRISHAHIHAILPFPVRQLENAIRGSGTVVVVENNATGQLRNLIGHFGVSHSNITSFTKYDGKAILASEIVNHIKELIPICQQ
jgi:2-oxoglutarate ferredoxin oxidoreductase subunit alpha